MRHLLSYFWYSDDDIDSVLGKLSVDWNEQAKRKALMHQGDENVVDILLDDGYTEEQLQYALEFWNQANISTAILHNDL